MLLLNNKQMIGIMANTLDHVDDRLVSHGKRVAYLMYRVLTAQNAPKRFSENELRDICIAGMLHDVGAYKTDEIDKMVVFETEDVWDHSIYGYLFLKHFSPLKNLAEVILYHHANTDHIKTNNADHKMIAQLISLTDRADIYSGRKNAQKDFCSHINKKRNIRYCDEVVDLYLNSGVSIPGVFDEMENDKEYARVMYENPLSPEEIDAYIDMLVHIIDFRSNQTVFHSVATASIACGIGKLLGLCDLELLQIRTGAMLHDIGKISTPLHILEGTHRLSDDEMKIMQNHAVMTDKILAPYIDQPMRGIASKHHEKLNGTGYPNKLGADDLSVADRVVAIADIFSALCAARSYKEPYPKEKIVGILEDMSAKNLLDEKIVALTVQNYEELVAASNVESAPVITAYEAISDDFKRICEEVSQFTKNGAA